MMYAHRRGSILTSDGAKVVRPSKSSIILHSICQHPYVSIVGLRRVREGRLDLAGKS